MKLSPDLDTIATQLRGYDPVLQVAALRALREEKSPVDAVVAVEAAREAQGRDDSPPSGRLHELVYDADV